MASISLSETWALAVFNNKFHSSCYPEPGPQPLTLEDELSQAESMATAVVNEVTRLIYDRLGRLMPDADTLTVSVAARRVALWKRSSNGHFQWFFYTWEEYYTSVEPLIWTFIRERLLEFASSADYAEAVRRYGSAFGLRKGGEA